MDRASGPVGLYCAYISTAAWQIGYGDVGGKGKLRQRLTARQRLFQRRAAAGHYLFSFKLLARGISLVMSCLSRAWCIAGPSSEQPCSCTLGCCRDSNVCSPQAGTLQSLSIQLLPGWPFPTQRIFAFPHVSLRRVQDGDPTPGSRGGHG